MANIQTILNKFPQNRFLLDEPMKNHTTFKIGGKADAIFRPINYKELTECIKICSKNNIPYFILGNGSNILVSDKGIRGIVISLLNINENVEMTTNSDLEITVNSSKTLKEFAEYACSLEYAGAEFARDIPGTVGGAVYMNAGAYDGDISQIFKEAKVLLNGEIVTFSKEDMNFAYRKSEIAENGGIILNATFKLNKGKMKQITEKQDEYRRLRVEKQPSHIEFPSCGSTFKRPEGYYAGKLIMDSNLQGFSVGDAQISTKHCGFVVNNANATCEDVLNLIKKVQEKVYENFGVHLETEVKFIGEK